MLTEFEQQFQTTLRQRMPANIRNDVQVATGAANQSGILVGIRSAVPLPPEFSSRRPEQVPGAADPRRVIRLRCQVEVAFVPANNQDRIDMVSRFDRVLYALDAADVQDGSAFASAAPDPGFLIHCLAAEMLDLPFTNAENEGKPLTLALTADGWFWPVGEVGQSGVAIGEIRLRGAVHPLLLEPAAPALTAGGLPQTLRLSFDARGTAQVTAGDLASLPFGSLAVRLEKEDGTAGDGTFSGGSSGSGGVRFYPIAGGVADITVIPPAEPVTEILVVAVDNGENGVGLEIGRFPLQIGAAA